jgi:hypothetical protein
MKAYVQALVFALAAHAAAAGAVSLSPDGSGQVLLYPYYTANGSQDTLLTIGNRVDEPQVARVRFLEGYNGRPVLEFDVYLDRNDVWTAVVTLGEGGRALLRSADPGCTVPAIPVAGAPFTTAMFDGSGAMPADPGPHGAARTREGFIEVIAGATLGIYSPTHLHITQVVPACGELPGSLFEDIEDHGKALYSTAAIISVGEGLYYAYDAVALRDFSTDPLYGPAMDASGPSLADAGGSAAGADAWIDGYGPLHFDRKIDAVSAVLARYQLHNQYIASPGLGARTDWIITLPTQRYYTDPAVSGSATALAPFVAPFQAPGVARVEFTQPMIYDRQGATCIGTFCLYEAPFHVDHAVNAVTFAQPDEFGDPSGVFGSALVAYLYPYADAGHVLLPEALTRTIEAEDGGPLQRGRVCVRGLPEIGFLAYNLVNANAQPGRLANYGGVYRDHWYPAEVYARYAPFGPHECL